MTLRPQKYIQNSISGNISYTCEQKKKIIFSLSFLMLK